MRYYVDTCIWLNLFKKEKTLVYGMPVWKIAGEFITAVLANNCQVLSSPIIFKELRQKLSHEEFEPCARFIRETSGAVLVDVAPQDKQLAKHFDSESGFTLGVGDSLHLALATKSGCVLVTRDQQLLYFAKKFRVEAIRPEIMLY